jgi:hypothetical protein
MASACVSDEDRIRANACSARYDLFEVVDRDDRVIKRQANERIICRDVVRRNWLDRLNRMEGAENVSPREFRIPARRIEGEAEGLSGMVEESDASRIRRVLRSQDSRILELSLPLSTARHGAGNVPCGAEQRACRLLHVMRPIAVTDAHDVHQLA